MLSPNIRLDEDVLIKKNIFALVLRLQKTFWSRPMYSSWPYIFKTFSRRLQGVLQKRVQDIFQTSSRSSEDVFKTFQESSRSLAKTSSRRLAKVSSRHLQDILKTYSRHLGKISSKRFQDISSSETVLVNKSSRSIAKTVIYKRICLGHTSQKFMVIVQNLKQW